MRRVLFFACFAALFARAEAAPLWTNIGPFGGEARSISSDASGRNVYVLNPRSGVFRSFNGGPWTLVFDAIERGVTPTRVVVDPLSLRVYAGTTTGLFRSDDNGVTWRQLSSVSILDAAAIGDEIVVATPNDALLRSVDGGDNWNSISFPGANVTIIRIDPHSTDRLIAVAAGSLYVSENAGNTWLRLLSPTNISSVAIGDLIYAGGPDGVWGCADNCTLISSGVDSIAAWGGSLYATFGDSVANLSTGRLEVVGTIPTASVLSLESTPSTLMAGTKVGVFTSTDGIHWFSRNDGLTNVRVTDMTFASGSLIVAAAGQGVFRRDGGAWTSVNAAGLLSTVPFLATNGSMLYAAVPGVGVFRSSNQGATWDNVTSGFSPTDLFGLAADGDKVVVTTFRTVVQSLDRGTTWQVLTSYPSLSASAVAVKGSTMVVTDVATAVVSIDDGATWQRSDLPSLIRRLAILGDQIYAATDIGLFVRRNGVWTLALPGQIRAMAISELRLFVASPNGVAFTFDGTHWFFVPGSETLPPDVTSVASDGSFVYAGTNGRSVFATSLQQRRRAVRR
jgi:hypothetical protein